MTGSKTWFLAISFAILYVFRLVTLPSFDLPDGATVKVTGRVSSAPYQKGSNQIIRMGRLTIKTSPFPEFFYGQQLELIGKVQRRVINRFKTEFALEYPTINLIDNQKTSNEQRGLRGYIYRLKAQIEALISRSLPTPSAGLLAGMLLGSEGNLPYEFLQKLRETGTIHIIVASGYNVSVVAGFLTALLVKFFRRKIAIIFSFLGIVFYVLLAGAEPPVVRAGMMGLLVYLGQLTGREYQALWGLVLAGVIMLFISPLILFDIGFQLSFLATAGILLIGPRLKMGEPFKTTLSAQLGVLPILLANFGQVSFLSPLVNALVLPVVPLVMGLGALGVAMGRFVLILCYPLLAYFVKVVSFFASLPFGSLKVGEISFWWAIGYYLVLILWLRRKKSSLA